MVRVERALLMITGLMMEFQNRYSYFGRQKCGLPPKGFFTFCAPSWGRNISDFSVNKA